MASGDTVGIWLCVDPDLDPELEVVVVVGSIGGGTVDCGDSDRGGARWLAGGGCDCDDGDCDDSDCYGCLAMGSG